MDCRLRCPKGLGPYRTGPCVSGEGEQKDVKTLLFRVLSNVKQFELFATRFNT